MHKQMAKYFETKFNAGNFERVCLILDIDGNGKALQGPSKEVYNKLQSYLGQANILEFCTEDQLRYGLEALFLSLTNLLKITHYEPDVFLKEEEHLRLG